jgi:LPXTG-motif cell wall-anchored protein
MFTFTITINDTKDADIWFSVQEDATDTNTIVKDLTTNATPEMRGGEKTGYYHAPSGSVITVSIQPGWNLRFTNLPNGTTYTIKETAKENYTFVNAAIDNNGTFSVESSTTTGSGTINESNTQYTVTYTNQAVTQQVYIQKTAQDAKTPLQGAVFSLYGIDGYNEDPQRALKTNLTSDANGKIDLGRLAVGKYYLVETKAPAGYILLSDPVEITVKDTGVLYEQITNSLSSSNAGVSGDNVQGYTLVVTNNAGYELPSTGGPGTRLYTILGSILIFGAGVLLWRRRRTI